VLGTSSDGLDLCCIEYLPQKPEFYISVWGRDMIYQHFRVYLEFFGFICDYLAIYSNII
jgi:hypothetical protein